VHWQLLDCMTAPYFYTLIVTSLPAFTFHSLAAHMSAALHSPNGIWTSPPAIKVALLQVLINHICDCEWLTSQFEPLPDVPLPNAKDAPLPNAPGNGSFESQALGCLAAPVVTCVPLPRKPETYRHELLPHSRIVPVTTDVWNRSVWAIQGHLIISDCSGGVCRIYWTPSSIQLALRALACGGGGEGSSSCGAESFKAMLPMRTSYNQALQWLLTWSRGVQQQHFSSFDSPKLFAWRNLHVDIRSLPPALPPRFFNFTVVPLPHQIIASARAAPLSEEHGAAAPLWRMLRAPALQRNHGPQLDRLLPSPVAVPARAVRAHSRLFAQVQLLLLLPSAWCLFTRLSGASSSTRRPIGFLPLQQPHAQTTCSCSCLSLLPLSCLQQRTLCGTATTSSRTTTAATSALLAQPLLARQTATTRLLACMFLTPAPALPPLPSWVLGKLAKLLVTAVEPSLPG
jgi:hypothetical protein